MNPFPTPLDLRKLKVYPLAQRRSMSRIEDILVNPDAAPPPISAVLAKKIEHCAQEIAAEFAEAGGHDVVETKAGLGYRLGACSGASKSGD